MAIVDRLTHRFLFPSNKMSFVTIGFPAYYWLYIDQYHEIVITEGVIKRSKRQTKNLVQKVYRIVNSWINRSSNIGRREDTASEVVCSLSKVPQAVLQYRFVRTRMWYVRVTLVITWVPLLLIISPYLFQNVNITEHLEVSSQDDLF